MTYGVSIGAPMFLFVAVVFATTAVGGAIMLVFALFMVGMAVLMQMPWNSAFNTFEDMITMDMALRKALDEQSTQGAATKEIATALAELRSALMESYYDALAIHLQTDTLTYGTNDANLLKIDLSNQSDGTTGTDLEEGHGGVKAEWTPAVGKSQNVETLRTDRVDRTNDHNPSTKLYFGLEHTDNKRTWLECDPNAPPPLLQVLLSAGWTVKVTHSIVEHVQEWVADVQTPSLPVSASLESSSSSEESASSSASLNRLNRTDDARPTNPPLPTLVIDVPPREETVARIPQLDLTVPDSSAGWVGLLGPNQSRAIGRSELELATLTRCGYRFDRCFSNHREATAWLSEV
jgi:hypothetical protein